MMNAKAANALTSRNISMPSGHPNLTISRIFANSMRIARTQPERFLQSQSKSMI